VVGIPQDFDSLDPHLSAATGTQEVMFNIFTGLISITPDGEIVMDLAESITPSEDLLSYTVVLKENVKFHNGETLSSADVAYTFDRLNGKTEDQKEPLTSNFAVIESIEAPDAQTVVFHLANVDVSFLSKLMIAIIPEDSGSSQAQTPVGAGPSNTPAIPQASASPWSVMRIITGPYLNSTRWNLRFIPMPIPVFSLCKPAKSIS
jgi:peptide/nickel transport system substrate-binding protein